MRKVDELTGTSFYVDAEAGAVVLNGSSVATGEVVSALRRDPEIAQLINWSNDIQGRSGGSPRSRAGGLFERDRYVTPSNIREQFKMAQDAVENDDVVGSVADQSEALAFGRVAIETDDSDQTNVWEQIAEDIDLETRLREIWREEFTNANVAVAIWWGTKSYTVDGKTDAGNAKRKKFENLRVPVGISVLDPLKTVPVGNFLFNQDQNCYIADWREVEAIEAAIAAGPDAQDAVIAKLLTSKFDPSVADRQAMTNLGINPEQLYVLNPRYVYRQTATRSQYQRWSPVRLKSVFELLDLKHQLRQMDRAHLLGAPLRADQRLATPGGWKAIGHAQVGDEVFSVDGTPTTITGVFPQGVLPMYRVTFTDGAEVFCDDSHLWTVKAPKGKWRTIPLRQILDEGLMRSNGTGASGKPQYRYRHEVPMAEPWQMPEATLPLDPYLLGYMLGDGNFDGTPYICSAEAGDFPWVSCLPAGIKVVQNKGRDILWSLSRIPAGRQRAGFGNRSNPVKNALVALQLYGVHCRDKFIPDEYLWASIDQRWALLQGLCDTDGSVRPGGCTFASRSEKLADGVVHLVQSLGGIASKSDYPLEGEPFWHVRLSFDGDRCPFRLKRKVAKWTPRKTKAAKRCISSVVRSMDAEAVCIKVDREDGLFITEGGVPTHNTNFLLLIRKGTDQQPGKPEEIAHLQAQARTLASVPVLVGDHRLQVDIITPKLDNTLNPERHLGLDVRIAARLWGMFITSHSGDDSVKLTKVVARGLENRRDAQRRSFTRAVLKATYDANEALTAKPTLRFWPRRIALDFDPALAAYLLDLRDRGDLSRASILAEIDYLQEEEARKRELEVERYDHIFQTQVPFNSPQNQPGGPVTPPGQPGPTDPKAGGRRLGGRRGGGGAAPGSGQGKPAIRPKAKTRPQAATAERDEVPTDEETREVDDDGA